MLGLLLFISGIILEYNGILKNENYNDTIDKLLVFDFDYEKIQDEYNNKGVIINFILLNNSDKDIKNDILKIKFYNKGKLIHELNYQITNLRIKEESKIKYQEMFDYQDIDNYEIIYNNKKIKVLNYEEYGKENIKDGQIGKSKLNISNIKFEEIDGELEMILDLENIGEEIITNQVLIINFYKNGKIIYNFEHTIEELMPDTMQKIKPILEIKREDFDNYEIIYNDETIKENGTLEN